MADPPHSLQLYFCLPCSHMADPPHSLHVDFRLPCSQRRLLFSHIHLCPLYWYMLPFVRALIGGSGGRLLKSESLLSEGSRGPELLPPSLVALPIVCCETFTVELFDAPLSRPIVHKDWKICPVATITENNHWRRGESWRRSISEHLWFSFRGFYNSNFASSKGCCFRFCGFVQVY